MSVKASDAAGPARGFKTHAYLYKHDPTSIHTILHLQTRVYLHKHDPRFINNAFFPHSKLILAYWVFFFRHTHTCIRAGTHMYGERENEREIFYPLVYTMHVRSLFIQRHMWTLRPSGLIVFQNHERVLLGEASKEKCPRGCQTHKEAPRVPALTGKAPHRKLLHFAFLHARERIPAGTLTKTKMQSATVVPWGRLYCECNPLEKRHRDMSMHLSLVYNSAFQINRSLKEKDTPQKPDFSLTPDLGWVRTHA